MTVIRRLAMPCALALLAGCSGTFTSKAPVSRAYILRPAAVVPAAAGPAFAGSLRVQRPNPGPGFETDRILLLRADRQLDFYATGHWAGPIPDMIGALALETLRRTTLFDAVYGEGTPMRADYFLQIQVRDFTAEYTDGRAAPVAHVVLDCTLGRRLDRTVVTTFTAEGAAPAAENRMAEVVIAYESALQQALTSVAGTLGAAATAATAAAAP
ncbi:MAG: membrane integrity-associated transporter subunit PqiC [Steroidobacteraceae bacterium]|nr:membrane integrity-associated transporter subunit PqiC [Steroidobacteraceae bacterium]